jgi:hypothetical protein
MIQQENNMTTKKLYTTTALIALMALATPALANDGTATDAGAVHHHHHHHHHMTKQDKVDFEKLHALHKELYDIATAPQFDKKAYVSTSSQIEDVHNQLEKQHDRAVADKLSTMSQQDRAAWAGEYHEHDYQNAHGWQDAHGWHNGNGWTKNGHPVDWNDQGQDNDDIHGGFNHNAEENGSYDGQEIPNH